MLQSESVAKDSVHEPVLGFVLFGGSLSGALIRDIRLARELASRGYPVHVWWAMDRPQVSPLADAAGEHWLFHGLRYADLPWPLSGRLAAKEAFGRFASWWWPDAKRARAMQKRSKAIDQTMEGFMRYVCKGVEKDAAVISRFASQLSRARVTHVLPMLSVLCPWVLAARERLQNVFRYLVTFQGYELYVRYARQIGLEGEILARLREVVARSDWPCVAVSEDYAKRVCGDIGLSPEQVVAIPPGVPTTIAHSRAEAERLLVTALPAYRRELPLVTYLGRRDAEKGLDLLLYAASLLRREGLQFQVAICGPTLFGNSHAIACRRLAETLGQSVLWRDHVSDAVRSALFICSTCVVYPSIHGEPFGMVPVEAMAHGTPAIVPDLGGVSSTVRLKDLEGGLRFRAWDSGHLARQLRDLLTNPGLRSRLAADGPRIADHYSIARLGDRILDHIGLPRFPHAGRSPSAVRLADAEPRGPGVESSRVDVDRARPSIHSIEEVVQ